jgi:hypothetical protein
MGLRIEKPYAALYLPDGVAEECLRALNLYFDQWRQLFRRLYGQ